LIFNVPYSGRDKDLELKLDSYLSRHPTTEQH